MCCSVYLRSFFWSRMAINSRLMLIETISFTTTPEEHARGAYPDHRRPFLVGRDIFFSGNYYLMDYELMGPGNARKAIARAEARKYGMKPIPTAGGGLSARINGRPLN